MKNKSARVLGVVITLMLIVSSIVAIPSAASAGTQSWTAITKPAASTATAGKELSATDITNVLVATDGTIYAVTMSEAVAPVDRLNKSTNGGQSWSILGGSSTTAGTLNFALATAGTRIVAIAQSKQTASRIYVAISDGVGGVNQVWVSTDSGATFPITYNPNNVAVGNITSMDVTYYSGGYYCVVGMSSGTTENVQIGAESGLFATWQDIGDATNFLGGVYDVAFSPNFATDNRVIGVGFDTTDVVIARKVGIGIGAWTKTQTFTGSGAAAVAAPVPAANIAFPSDYATTGVYFVGLNGTATDDAYMITSSAIPLDLNVGGSSPATVRGINSLAVTGPTAAATLVVGVDGAAGPTAAAVRRSSDSGVTWTGASKQPTGGDTTVGSLTFVALGATGTVYAGTSGSSAPADNVANDNSGFSVSTDGGATFNQRSLIDDTISVIDQVIPAGGSLFLVTHRTAGATSLWRTTAAGVGGDWYRVVVYTDPAVLPVVPAFVAGASSAYATDKTVWVAFADTTVGVENITARKSVNADAGFTFSPVVSPITAVGTGLVTVTGQPTVIKVLGATSVLIGDVDGNVFSTTDGFAWAGTTVPITAPAVVNSAIVSMDAQGANVLVGDAGGKAYISTNTGTSFRALTATTTAATGSVFVAFDPDFATNAFIYETSANKMAGRVAVGATAAADVVFDLSAAALTAGNGSGIVALKGPSTAATLYVADTGVALAPQRSINPNRSTSAVATFEITGPTTASAGLTAATTAGVVGIKNADGTNSLWVIDTATPGVITFTDTLNIAAAAGTATATGATTASLTWPAVNNATAYAVTITTPFGATAPTCVVGTGSAATSATVTGMTTGAAYTFTVAVAAASPDASYASASATLQSQPGAAPWDPSQNAGGATSIFPAPGASTVSLTPTLQWNTSAAATGFELLISSSGATTGARLTTGDVADKTGANALVGSNQTVYTVGTALKANTTYFWQVRAIIGAQSSPWSAVFPFTTAPAVTTTTAVPPVTVINTTVTYTNPPATTVTYTNPPATTVTYTNPPATTITNTVVVPPAAAQATPAWVWAIIAIGGILLIVVIVLIARTRKV